MRKSVSDKTRVWIREIFFFVFVRVSLCLFFKGISRKGSREVVDDEEHEDESELLDTFQEDLFEL